MNQKELIEKFYNGEITRETVIIKRDVLDEEYPDYILNDGRMFWEYEANENVHLSFFVKNDDYEYDIISRDEFMKMIDEKAKQKKIEELKKELAALEQEPKENSDVHTIKVTGIVPL